MDVFLIFIWFLDGIISIFVGLLMKRNWCIESGFKDSLLSFVVLLFSNRDCFTFIICFIVVMDVDVIKSKRGSMLLVGMNAGMSALINQMLFFHLLLMFATMHMREREVVSSAMTQDFVHLRHQNNRCVVRCTGRGFVVCLPNSLV